MNQCWTSIVNLKSDENNFYLPRICFASPSIKKNSGRVGDSRVYTFSFAVWATYVPSSLSIAQLETGRNFHTQGFVGRPRHLSDWISIIRHQSTSLNGTRLHLTQFLAEYFSIKTIFFQWITWQTSLVGEPATNNSQQRRKWRNSVARMWKLELNNKKIILFNYS